jgi:hypothetical protein
LRHRPELSSEVIFRAEAAGRLARQKKNRLVRGVKDAALFVAGAIVTIMIYGPMMQRSYAFFAGPSRE